MMKTAIKASVAALAAAIALPASAATVTLDDFVTSFNGGADTEITRATGSENFGPTALVTGATRSGSLTINSNGSPGQIAETTIRIFGGELSVNNGNDVDSTTILSYDVGDMFDLLADATGATEAALRIRVLFADTGRTLTLRVNGVETDSQFNFFGVGQGGPTPAFADTVLTFDTSLLALAADDTLELQIDGLPGLDYRIDILSLRFPETEVPAPGALGLLGLGLVGLGAAARRRRV